MPRPDRSRAALIHAAAKLFRRQGYSATGVNQILEMANARAGSLYHHFPRGKQELAAAVADKVGSDMNRLLRRLLASGMPAIDVVDGWLDTLADGLTLDWRDGCPVQPIATESVHVSELARAASARAFADWVVTLAGQLRAEGWPDDEADRLALAVISLGEGAVMLSKTAGTKEAIDAAKLAARSLLTSRKPTQSTGSSRRRRVSGSSAQQQQQLAGSTR